MNNKGFVGIWTIVILMALIVGLAVQQNTDFDIEQFKGDFSIERVNLTITEGANADLVEGLNDFINGMFGLMEGVARWVAQYAYDNPTVPWKLLIWGLLISIAAPIIILVFKLAIIIFLLIKEAIQSKNERNKKNDSRRRG